MNFLKELFECKHRSDFGQQDEDITTAVTQASIKAIEKETFPESSTSFTIDNIVATFTVGCVLDLKAIVQKARNVEYQPSRFPGLYLHIRNPKATAIAFDSGKVIVMGTKSERDARQAGRKFARILQKAGDSAVRFLSFTVNNIIASSSVGFEVNLTKLSRRYPTFCSFDSDAFPGAAWREESHPKVTALIFRTGKVVVTGAKSGTQVSDMLAKVSAVVSGCRVPLKLNGEPL